MFAWYEILCSAGFLFVGMAALLRPNSSMFSARSGVLRQMSRRQYLDETGPERSVMGLLLMRIIGIAFVLAAIYLLVIGIRDM